MSREVNNFSQEHSQGNIALQFTYDQQRAANKFLPNFGQYSENITIVQERSGFYFVRKRLGEKWNLPKKTVDELAIDYHTHIHQLQLAGITNLAQNYNVQVVPAESGAYLQVDQLFYPFGSGLDWIKNNRDVAQITQHIIDDFIQPLLQKNPKQLETTAWIDLAVRNFAILPANNGLQAIYFDFFPPLIRDPYGKVKQYENLELVPQGELIGEYLGFTKPGILHRFIRKNYTELSLVSPIQKNAWEIFSKTIETSLTEFLELYFPGLTVEQIAQTDYLERQFLNRQEENIRSYQFPPT